MNSEAMNPVGYIFLHFNEISQKLNYPFQYAEKYARRAATIIVNISSQFRDLLIFTQLEIEKNIRMILMYCIKFNKPKILSHQTVSVKLFCMKE